jgi:hypothetical protein
MCMKKAVIRISIKGDTTSDLHRRRARRSKEQSTGGQGYRVKRAKQNFSDRQGILQAITCMEPKYRRTHLGTYKLGRVKNRPILDAMQLGPYPIRC